jgi:ribosomal protein S18 acetylase RimI-like enzyme
MPSLPLALQPPASEFAIRPVQWEDIGPLCNHCWPERPYAQVQRLIGRVLRLADHEHGLGLVASDGEQVIGYGQFTHWPHAAEINDLVVSEPWRNRGIGTTLIQTLVRSAINYGATAIEIGATLENTRAMALYRALGFTDQRTVVLKIHGIRTPVLYLELLLEQPN